MKLLIETDLPLNDTEELKALEVGLSVILPELCETIKTSTAEQLIHAIKTVDKYLKTVDIENEKAEVKITTRSQVNKTNYQQEIRELNDAQTLNNCNFITEWAEKNEKA